MPPGRRSNKTAARPPRPARLKRALSDQPRAAPFERCAAGAQRGWRQTPAGRIAAPLRHPASQSRRRAHGLPAPGSARPPGVDSPAFAGGERLPARSVPSPVRALSGCDCDGNGPTHYSNPAGTPAPPERGTPESPSG